MSLLLLALILILIFGCCWGYSRAGWTGYGPGGLIGLLVLVLIIGLVTGYI